MKKVNMEMERGVLKTIVVSCEVGLRVSVEMVKRGFLKNLLQ
jgi:hypothetical protein